MNSRSLKFFGLALLVLLSVADLSARAQSPLPHLDDPANLAGERVSAPDLADALPINHGAPALEQLLRKLRTRASFMLIVAHPDDEDGGMLTYLSRGQGARVAMLTLTRGEGGQNLMSGDFEDALGLIRTQELLAADRYMGVDQFFGTEVDFGFSKTKEEAFAKWTHERVLYDAVRAVRLYRPLVIASVFIGAPTDGHGHHQVAGEIAQEVFKAAGDPNVFPDQIAQGLEPWQPLKVYARIPFARIDAQGMFDYATNQYAAPRFENYVTGKVSDTVPKANVVVPEGTTDALLGGLGPASVSYVQFAREGLALQKTQIGGGARLARAGAFDVQYHRYGSRVLGADGKPQPDDGDGEGLESGFFAGIDTSLPGMASLAPEVADKFRPALEKIDQQITDAQAKFDPDHLDAIAPQLRTALAAVDEFIHELENSSVNDLPPVESYNLLHEFRIKRVQLNNALALALGLKFDATASASNLIAGSEENVSTRFTEDSDEQLTNFGWGVFNAKNEGAGSGIARAGKPTPHAEVENAWQLDGRVLQTVTRPYFSRPDIEQPYYDIEDPALRNAPETPAALHASLSIEYDGVKLELQRVVHSGTQPTSIVPPVSVAVDRHADALPSDKPEVAFSVVVQPPESRPQVDIPGSWKALSSGMSASFPGLNEFRYEIPSDGHGAVTLHASVKLADGKSYSEGYRAVGYGDLTRTNYYTPATLRVVPVDVTTAPALKIGYLPGTGDDVPAALRDLGVAPEMITAADLTAEKLKPYDAVILGVRPYEAHGDLAAASAALNAYAANGGVVIVQYVARELPAGVAPYPLSLGANEKVVDESAPVAILDPTDPLLTWPNKITAADFSGWVEERGHGFMGSWDAHYKPLLESHDPGQKPQEGGLLVARTGKGAWIYLAYALYRQLPEGVPGPYRLLANLISAGKGPQAGSR